MSTSADIPNIASKPATPLLLPPAIQQSEHIERKKQLQVDDSDTSTTISSPGNQQLNDNNNNNNNNKQNNHEAVSTSSCSDDVDVEQGNKKQNGTTKHRRRRKNNASNHYILQPMMGPIMQTPSLEPTFSVASNDSPRSPAIHDDIQQTSRVCTVPQARDHHTSKKYIILNTRPPHAGSASLEADDIDKTNGTGFIGMRSKKSLTLDNPHVIEQSHEHEHGHEHEEDQKIVETHPTESATDGSVEHDKLINSDLDHEHQHQHQLETQSQRSIPSNSVHASNLRAFPQANDPKLAAFGNRTPGGIPTTPSYPTPLNGSVSTPPWTRQSAPNTYYQTANSQPLSAYAAPHFVQTPRSQHSAHPPIPPTYGDPVDTHEHRAPPPPLPAVSVSRSPSTMASTGYSLRRQSSQFMERQQHRHRINKLKFTRTKWTDHGNRVLLNTTVRVDRVCHALVQTRQRFGVCPVEMRQLSLTVAVIERAIYGYGRQVQETKQKAKDFAAATAFEYAANAQQQQQQAQQQQNAGYGYSTASTPLRKPMTSTITPIITSQQAPQTQRSSLSLPTSMEASISAPTGTANYTHRDPPTDTDTTAEHVEVQSDDSVDTIGRCTNTSIVTGTPCHRATSPITQQRLARHSQMYKPRNLQSSKQFTNTVHNANLASYLNNPAAFHYPPSSPVKPALAVQKLHNEQLAWRHPAGVVSLLEILGRTLRATEEQLVAIGKIASLRDFVSNNKLIWVISIIAGAYIFAVPFSGQIRYVLVQCHKFTSWFIGKIAPSSVCLCCGLSKAIVAFVNNMTIKNVLFRFIPPKLRRLLSHWIEYILSSFFSMFNKLQHISVIESASMWMNRFRFMILPTLIYIIHKCVLRVYLMRLQRLQNQLNTIILHWQLCMTAMTTKNRLDQCLADRLKLIQLETRRFSPTKSFKSRNGSTTSSEDDSAAIDIYQWILRLVPPSAHIDACFWYSANLRLRILRKLMDFNYAVSTFYYRIFGSSTFFWPMVFPILAYYVVNQDRAACRANEFLANPDIRIIRVLYTMLDSKFARWMTLKVFPKLHLMPPLQTAITFEIRVDDMNSWNDDSDLNRISGINSINDAGNESAGNIKFQNIDTVRIKIFANKKLNIKPDYINSGDANGAEFLNENPPSNLMEQNTGIPARNIINIRPHHARSRRSLTDAEDSDDSHDEDMDDDDDERHLRDIDEDGEDDGDEKQIHSTLCSPMNPRLDHSLKRTQQQIVIADNNEPFDPFSASFISVRNHNPNTQENGVIFYIHGGGFLGNFCASDLRILSHWSNLTNAPIVEVDYSLIPSKWPTALQECILAYKCLCYGRLGFNAKRIAVIGDSNGGGLAVSMILSIIKDGLRVPDALILTSPILSLRQNYPTTSRLLFNMDPLVPMNLIVQCTKYYLIPTLCDDENDPLISPLVCAPDYLLASFPPTTIVVGGLDPFLDDSIDFAHRLSNHDVNVDVKLKIYKFAPHGFLGFSYLLPDVNHAIHLIAECIDHAFLS